MKKRVIILIVALVLIIGVTVGGFIYDRSDLLIARTTGIMFEEGYDIVTIHKHGFIFRRSGYEAKVRVPHDDPVKVIDAIYDRFGAEGAFLTYADYYALSKQLFEGERLVPKVESGSNVWTCGIEFEDKQNLYFVLVSEDSENAYVYIYYSRY